MSLKHHEKFELCRTRPKYRQSKKLTAVKVYSVANESKHLLVFGVPALSLSTEIRNKFSRFGTVENSSLQTDTIRTSEQLEIEPFTECYHIKFARIECARKAKKVLDASSFYGGILHISYAPELESIEELKQKLDQRYREVKYRSMKNRTETEQSNQKLNSKQSNEKVKTVNART